MGGHRGWHVPSLVPMLRRLSPVWHSDACRVFSAAHGAWWHTQAKVVLWRLWNPLPPKVWNAGRSEDA